MHTFGRVTIIGTSHIAEKSIKEIEHTFYAIQPDIIAVELDRNRLHALMKDEKPNYSPRLIREIGVSGYLFAVIGGLLQKRLGSIVGIRPGSEMLRAALLARDNHKKIALIDQDVRVTLRRFSQEFTLREKMRLLFDLVFAPFSKKLRIDLSSVPASEVISALLSLLKKRYPGLHKALIEERNSFMAGKLRNILDNYPDEKIMVVVGAGHEAELAGLLGFKKKLI